MNPIEIHNQLRARHGAPPLTLNKQLCDQAMVHAKFLAQTEKWEHGNQTLPDGTYVGQNLARGGLSLTWATAIQIWYDESKQYKGDWSPTTGHFTQLVWHSTSQMGYATIISKTGRRIFVCTYLRAGNVAGRFKENVKPPIAVSS